MSQQAMSGPGDGIQIEPRALQERLARGEAVTLVDVRQGWEHNICQIAGSRLIPMDELPQRVGELPQDQPLVIVCHHGMRSFHATLWLRQNGFPQAVNLAGGVDGWARDVDGALARY
ncbi:MAG TPA: rhodanese-like domain-containing protein [Terriglobia bacterium]|nr:rhodanese-like domain-containing protein [Terriglobia bacterium]